MNETFTIEKQVNHELERAEIIRDQAYNNLVIIRTDLLKIKTISWWKRFKSLFSLKPFVVQVDEKLFTEFSYCYEGYKNACNDLSKIVERAREKGSNPLQNGYYW